MTTRERPVHRGRRRAEEQRARLASEIRLARINAGLSLRDVGRAAGLDHARIWRFERNRITDLRLEDLGAIAAIVGLDLSLRAFPGGDPIRDVAHARLLERLRRELHPSLRWRTEVPLPGPGEQRAWDAVIGRDGWRVGVEAETAIRDVQGLERRLEVKRRDGAVDHLVLLVADTRRNRDAIRDAPAAFRSLPLGSRDVLASIRMGREPAGSGIVIR